MLGKLIKHELKATAKTFLWLYAAFAVIAVLNAIVTPGTFGIFWEASRVPTIAGTVPALAGGAEADMAGGVMRSIVMAMYGLSIAAMAIVTLVVIILRFFRNLLGDEGYLMLTLPVSREQHILSKLLVGVIWSVCSTVLVALSGLLVLVATGAWEYFADGFAEFLAMGPHVYRWIFMVVLLMLVGAFVGVLMLYAAMAIGPNLLKNRIGGSVLAFIIIYVVTSFVTAGAMLAVSFSSGTIVAPFHPFVNEVQSIALVDTYLWVAIGVSAGIGVACWFLTRFMVKRKLNLA
ncbi:MAG: hypothetical protein FWH32_04115 [Clostridiales bacterium]|nr:hypothetical protein [Clostridiales bacterium]